MSTTVTYKGNTLTTVDNATKTLKTAGKYMEGDVILTDTDNTLVVTLSYNDQTEMWEPDKTFAKIQAAYEAGKTIAFEADQMAVWWIAEGQNVATAFYYAVGEETNEGNWFVLSYGINSTGVFFDYDYTYYPAPSLQSKTATPTEQQQAVTPDSGYDGLSSVTVDAIPSTYVGSGITQRSSSDLTSSGDTVTVPAGYYSAQASKAVANGTEGTPTATKGTVSNHAISVTPSVTNGAGYIAGGTKTGTAVTITASELVDGTLSITTSGTHDVTNYASVSAASGSVSPTVTKGAVSSNHSIAVYPYADTTQGFIGSGRFSGSAVTISASELVSGTYTVDSSGTKDITNYANISVPSGSATAPASITGTAATVSTGTNTLTLTKSVSVTPSVTAGYVSSGTAGDSSVSLTANVTTKAAATITPGTTDQTIAAGTYLTGAQTIAGDADLIANNIISTANIFGVQGNVVVQNYYTGSSEPSSSLGQNGDIYLQE